MEYIMKCLKKSKDIQKEDLSLEDIVIHVSGEFLTENLPRNYTKMTKKEISNFISERTCYLYEDKEPKDIYNLIVDTSMNLCYYLMQKKLIVLKSTKY